MPSISVGSVSVRVVPSVENFTSELRRRIVPGASQVGLEIGQAIGAGIREGIGDPLQGPLEESRRRQRQRGPRDGDEVAGAFARGFKARLEAAFRSLPKAELDANSTPADRKIAELRARMEELSKKTIGVDIDAATALAKMESLKARLEALGRDANIDVRADTAAAAAQLAAVQAEVNRLDGRTARVDVDTSAAIASLGSLAAAMAGVAAIPLAATIGAGVVGLAGAFGAAGAGFAGVAAVAVPAISNIKTALAAEKAAQTASTVAAGQGQARALALAGAQQTLAAAVRNAGFAHQQALDQVRAAEQQYTQAQVAAANAARALTQARLDARRSIEDLKNQTIDAGLAVEEDRLAVDAAKLSYDQYAAAAQAAAAKVASAQTALTAALAAQQAVSADPAATDQAKAQAQATTAAATAAVKAAEDAKKTADAAAKQADLNYRQSVQRLKEQQLQLNRLQQDEKSAAKAGVDGSKQVLQARQQLAQANQQVTNSERALSQARAGVARADRQAADQVAAARRGVTQASLSASSATSKLGAAMAALTGPERRLVKEWKAFTGVYKGWAKALEPEVFPVLAGGMSLVVSQLPKLNGLVRGSALGMRVLERDAQAALGGKFWTGFIDDVGKEAPVAIVGLGHIAGDVFTGISGVIRAALPYTSTLLGSVEHLTAGFSRWGQQLGTSSEFGQFFAFVQREGPVITHDLQAVGGAVIDIAKAIAPLGALQLAVIGPVADGLGFLARTSPGLIQVAVAVYAVNKATKALGLVGVARGFLGLAVAEGAASAGASTLGLRMRALGAWMMGANAATVSTRTALLGLGAAAGVAAAVLVLPPLIQKINESETGAVQSTNDLAAALTKLGQTGQWSDALARQFKVNSMVGDLDRGRKSVEEFTRSVRVIANPNWADYINHTGQAAFGWIPGVTTDLETAHNKITAVDTALANMVKTGNLSGANAAFGQLATQAAKSGVSVDALQKLFPNYSAVVSDATLKTALLNVQLSANAHRFADSEREVVDFGTSLQAASGLLAINGKAFFGNSQQALANRGSIIQTASVVQGYADNLVDTNKVTYHSIKLMQDQRQQLIDQAVKFGLSRKKAKEYVDQLLHIPDTVSTGITVNAKGDFKMKGGAHLLTTNDLLGIGKNAAGGLIHGAGGPRADNQVTRISPGEFVVNAPATSRYLPFLAAINDEGNKGTSFRGQGYAGGGLVLPDMAPRVTLPSFAGGGLFAQDSYSTSFKDSGDAAKTIAAATKGVADGLAGMTAYAIGRTALISQLAMIAAALGAGGTGDGGKAVQFARAQLGEPYVWGATGPNSWDCSGLTHAAWKAAGKEIGRTTYQQINAGRAGSRAQALPGDLHLPHAGHVMMFNRKGGTGGGQEMIHAPHTGDVVRYAPWRGGGSVRLIATPGGGGVSGGFAQSASAAKSYARSQMDEFGWSGSQFSPLERLWQRESNWRWNARNGSSGAYGIPQSLPASKMRSAGADYLTNALTQVRWGLGYIQGRYGNPAGAWAHSQRTGWYDNGGYLPPGLSTVYNGTGKPEPVFTSEQWDMVAGSSGGSAPEYHAHFDGATKQSIQHEVRTAFHAMEVAAGNRERIGRRR